VIRLDPERIAAAAGAEIARRGTVAHPERGVADSRDVAPGDLFFGLPGEQVDGGEFAGAALAAGAWGAIVAPSRAEELARGEHDGWVLSARDALRALQGVAREWRRAIGCPVVGITGSTGKTSVKDICRALLPFRVHASPANYNTEIGLPLAILSAPESPETEVIVLEMAMRGLGQIAELCEVAEPDVGAITNVGPVHLELLGTLDAIAEAKAELLQGLRERGRAVVPADAEALEPHLNERLVTIAFGPGGDVFALRSRVEDDSTTELVGTPHGEQEFRFPFTEAYNLTNALAAIAIGVALDAPLTEMASRAPEIVFSRLRGERLELRDGVVILNDCYNANPMSMRAALEHLAARTTPGRRVAVLGEMAELGPDGPGYHREIGAYARELGVGPIVGVGELAQHYAPDEWVPDARAAVPTVHALLEPDDAVLVKGSRSVGLELLSDEIAAMRAPRPPRESA
jgi:UDP-N-acetylmuramoyl-tripeptide--D-alanyl-D-alanine ligase